MIWKSHLLVEGIIDLCKQMCYNKNVKKNILQITTKGEKDMSECMQNVKEQLRKSREVCPGLSESAYYFADYMSYMANDCLVPEGMEMAVILCIYDILHKQNNTHEPESQESFEYLIRNSGNVLKVASSIPAIIDKISSEEFAKKFRKLYDEKSPSYPWLAK